MNDIFNFNGASIGYLKNLAILAKITAGINVNNIKKCLKDIGVGNDSLRSSIHPCCNQIVSSVRHGHRNEIHGPMRE
jgi:hypothetical protein